MTNLRAVADVGGDEKYSNNSYFMHITKKLLDIENVQFFFH